MQILDAVIGGGGMAMIHDSVTVRDGKPVTNLVEYCVGSLLSSIGVAMMVVRCIDPEFRWFKKRGEEN